MSKSKLNDPTVEYRVGSTQSDTSDSFEIDLHQLERNLTLTPEERIIEHQNALELVLELEAAGRKQREESQ